MITTKVLQQLAETHGTPLFVIDHDELRSNYATFKKHLPRVQAYYAVKANPDPAIVKTLFDAGASFDVSSIAEFRAVHENIKAMPEKEQHEWIWENIIYANPIKANETLMELDQYKPLVTFDNRDEILKIKEFAPNSGLVLRLRVSNAGAMVELSSKFGAEPEEAVDMILEAEKEGLTVEGLSFHVGSQTTNFENYVQAIDLAALIFRQAKERGYDKMNLLDIGGGFPAPYDASVKPFSELAKRINAELDRLFPPEIKIIAEPGRFIVGPQAQRCRRSSARRYGTENSAITLMTESITPFPVSSSTTVNIIWNPLKKARHRFAPCSVLPVTGWMLFR